MPFFNAPALYRHKIVPTGMYETEETAMLLFYSPTSPFARNVRAVARERGLTRCINEMSVAPYDDDPALLQANPLGRVPTLVLNDGQVLLDSAVICAYLDAYDAANDHGTRLIPAHDGGQGREFWRISTHVALADTIMELALSGVIERKRPPAQQSPDAVARAFQKIERALGALERYVTGTDGWNMAHVATACALDYLEFRFADYLWRATYPALGTWLDDAHQRPALKETAPYEGT